ncbi:MAG: hypothetical protein LH480_14325 [Rubrivivax sp.]|nr:hypothetical protein [Rubrivivax sp.]
MSRKTLVSLLAALTTSLGLLSAPALAGPSDQHDLTPKHGGVVIEAKNMDYELVAKADRLSLHVRDHGKAFDISKASAKLTLLTGVAKSDVQLSPAGDRLEARGNFTVSAGTKAVAVVSWPGKAPVTARFTVK